jgi:hypothetical protein
MSFNRYEDRSITRIFQVKSKRIYVLFTRDFPIFSRYYKYCEKLYGVYLIFTGLVWGREARLSGSLKYETPHLTVRGRPDRQRKMDYLVVVLGVLAVFDLPAALARCA